MVDNPPDEQLRMRVNAQDFTKFKRKSENTLGKPYQVFLREIISAFNDGRLQIILTPEQQDSLGEVYNVNRK